MLTGRFQLAWRGEKPPQGTAPSNLIISGRYILGPEIFPILANIGKGAGGEIQLTDGMKKLAETQNFYGVRFDGKTYDTQHYNLSAIIAVGYKVNSERAVQFRKWATGIIESFTIKGFAMFDDVDDIGWHAFFQPFRFMRGPFKLAVEFARSGENGDLANTR